MKKRTTFMVEAVKIFINCITVPLYFIRLFCQEASIPYFDENGETIIHHSYHYYSIYDKINAVGVPLLVWGAIAIIVASITVSVLRMVFQEKKALESASSLAFGGAIVLFFSLLLMAMSIRFCY